MVEQMMLWPWNPLGCNRMPKVAPLPDENIDLTHGEWCGGFVREESGVGTTGESGGDARVGGGREAVHSSL